MESISLTDKALADARTVGSAPARVFTPRELAFAVDYSDESGEVHHWTVVSRLMDGDELTLVDRLTAQLANAPWEKLPPEAQDRFSQIAWLRVQLRDAPKELLAAIDVDAWLRLALFNKAVEHHNRRFRRNDGAGDLAARAPRFVISEVAHPTATGL